MSRRLSGALDPMEVLNTLNEELTRAQNGEKSGETRRLINDIAAQVRLLKDGRYKSATTPSYSERESANKIAVKYACKFLCS